MPATDKGWFDSVAIDYARCRPHYPDAFFAWMADQSPALTCCWDAACGNGQASIGLSRWFNRVEATDLSAQQIAAAETGTLLDDQIATALGGTCLQCVCVCAFNNP